MRRIILACALAGILGVRAFAEVIPTADPVALGFSPERLTRLGKMLDSDIKAGRVPGAVVLVARHGKIAYFEAFGMQNKQTPMRKDSIFRIYSMTKPIISAAVMMLWEEGRFDIDDPIAKYSPTFKILRSPSSVRVA
jgi:CubicO group peptidase (beta-lactamase class C family)